MTIFDLSWADWLTAYSLLLTLEAWPFWATMGVAVTGALIAWRHDHRTGGCK